jgi:hypothetical protein
MNLEAFFLALKVAEDHGLGQGVWTDLEESGLLVIEDAWSVLGALWHYLDTDQPLPFKSEWELREALRVYDMSDDGYIVYIDTCEVEYMVTGSCNHVKVVADATR